MTIEEIIFKLKSNENFTFARYGDGEINAVLGVTGKNTDGHNYYKDMGVRLRDIIKSKPDYVMGLQNLVQHLRKDDINFKELIQGIDWVNSDVIHYSSIRKNNLEGLFQALTDRDIIIVGNIDMAGIHGKIHGKDSSWEHIVINKENCWIQYKDVLNLIRDAVSKDVVILYCASMMSEVLIDDLYNLFGDEITQIDIGSAFDPYVGKITRSYHRSINI